MPQFSIIITCFNHREFIGEAVQSALNQTHPAKEIIVVDDCSIDGSQQVLESFSSQVRVITNKKNLGPNMARNIGAAMAEADYLVFLDGDDLLRRDALTVYNCLAERNGPDCILCTFDSFDLHVPSLSIPEGRPIEFVEYQRLLLKDRTFSSSASAIVLKRLVFQCVGGWSDLFPCEDSDLFLRACSQGTAIQILSPATALKRNHPNNYSRDIRAMTNGILRIIAEERSGRYKRETRYARYCFLGGPAFAWTKNCLSIGAFGVAVRLAIVSWPMIVAASFHRIACICAHRSKVHCINITDPAHNICNI